MKIMKTLIKNGDIILDGTLSRAEKEMEAFEKLGQLEDIEKELGIELITLFDYDKNPFESFELEQEHNKETLYFDGDSFYGHYTQEEFLSLIKRLIKAYIETWAFSKEELL